MREHKSWQIELDSYELEEVQARLGDVREPRTVIRITIRGKNIVMRALEPVVRINGVLVQYPEITLDEQAIVGFLTEVPKEGARIRLEYSGHVVAEVKEGFTRRKLRRS